MPAMPPPPDKSRETRLSEVLRIYSKLRDNGLLDDPGLAEMKEACARFVRDGEPASGSVRLRLIGRNTE